MLERALPLDLYSRGIGGGIAVKGTSLYLAGGRDLR